MCMDYDVQYMSFFFSFVHKKDIILLDKKKKKKNLHSWNEIRFTV